MKPIIEIKNLNFSFDKKNYLLEDINLEIFKNQTIGIAGKNGSGKSTFGKILTGLLTPTSGEIISEMETGDISLVFQNPNNQIIGTRVMDELAFALENRGVEPIEIGIRINELAKKLNILELLEKNPHELSGGQKQIVAIATVLIFNPKIIILDEITSMLDRSSKKLVYEMLEQIKNEHILIFISHDVEELSKCDRILYFENKKIILDTTPEKYFENKSELPLILEIKKNLLEKNYEKSEVENWIHKLK